MKCRGTDKSVNSYMLDGIFLKDALYTLHKLIGGRSCLCNGIIGNTEVFCYAEIVVRQKLNKLNGISELCAEFGSLTEVVIIAVEERNNGDTNLKLSAGCGNLSCVIDNGLIGDGYNGLVLFGIHMLEVIKEEVCVGKNLLNGLPGGKAGCIDGNMNTLGLKTLCNLNYEINLSKALTAGDGNTAAGTVIEGLILKKSLYESVNSIILAADVKGIGIAYLGTLSAVIAEGTVYMDELYHFVGLGVKSLTCGLNGTLGAGLDAALLANFRSLTAHGYPAELRIILLGLGGVAPGAAERAAL